MLERNNISNVSMSNDSMMLSMRPDSAPIADGMDEAEKSKLLQSTAQGRAIVSKADHLAALLEHEDENEGGPST